MAKLHKYLSNNNLYIFLLLICGSFLTLNCTNQTNQHSSVPGIDSLLQSEVNAEHVAGAVIQVMQDGKTLHRKAYGYADLYNYHLAKLDTPVVMTTEKMFDLASLTKIFSTTFGIMMLVDRGEISLDAPVKTYLHEFSGGGKDSITIRHLLTHTSGLYQWKPLYYHASTSQEARKYIASLPLEYKVGEARHYSDLGFMLLGYIIEQVSGQRLDEFMAENLYQPLGLKHTAFTPKKHGFDNFAATSHGNPFEYHMVADDNFGYRCTEDVDSWNGWRHYTLIGEVNDGNSYYANQGIAGHAGLFSTVDDLQQMLNLLLARGKFDSKELISQEVISEFLTKDKYGNGLGWAMDPDVISAEGAPPGTFGHTGFTGTNVVVMPTYNLSVILLTNRQNVGPQPNGYYYNLNPTRQKIVDLVLASLGKGSGESL